MSVTTINQILLKNPVSKDIVYEFGKEDSTFEHGSVKFDESSLKEGQVLIKTILLSNDPTQRGWLSKETPEKVSHRTYAPAIKAGEVVRSLGLGEVVYSKSEKYVVGDKVSAMITWADYTVVPEAQVFSKIDESKGLPLTMYLSALGMTALTAYFGLTEVGKVTEGQTVVISAASGATGSVAVQIAKHILKAKNVVGISGSDSKGKWVKSLGADHVVNYNSPTFAKDLATAIGPDFADAYFDNVGGEVLDTVLPLLKDHGRVMACGAISGYNDPSLAAVKNWFAIITQKLTVQGFLVMEFSAKVPQAIGALVQGIQTGKIKAGEGLDLVDVSKDENPLESVPKAWSRLFSKDKGPGKLVTKLV
ncbi:hypothetical protein CAAN1_10S01420 [[Candida] anglica]|uniref:Enoyl reductase (ER) domain-containing protein n=1 Tax=[Candida] anglica TaxID=148631 RepID=A0ABP0EE99_9ASCO